MEGPSTKRARCFIGHFVTTPTPEAFEYFAAMAVDENGMIVARHGVTSDFHQCRSEVCRLADDAEFKSSFESVELLKQPPASDASSDDAWGVVVAGFYDAHIHAISSGIKALYGCSLLDHWEWGPAKDALTRYARTHLGGRPWLVGSGWHRNWFGGAYPDSATLDEVTTEHCIYLRDKAGHVVWFNTPGMRRFEAHFGPDTIARWRSDGKIQNGCVCEVAGDAAIQLLPALTTAQRRDAIDYIQRELRRVGIVGYQEAGLFPGDHEAYCAKYGDAPAATAMRVRGLCRLCPEDDMPTVVAAAEGWVKASSSPNLRFDGLKVFLDGSAANGSAAMIPSQREGYVGSGGGRLFWHDEALRAAAARLAAPDCAVRTLHLHVIGNGGVLQALRCADTAALDVQFAHFFFAPLSHNSDVDPAIEEKMTASEDHALCEQSRVVFSPIWFSQWKPEYAACYGAARAKEVFPWWVFTNRANVSFGSDYPVSTFDPVAGIVSAVQFGVPPPLALFAATAGAANACGFGQVGGGQLREGARADFVHLVAGPISEQAPCPEFFQADVHLPSVVRNVYVGGGWAS